jgi:hypothetical protein
VDDLQKQRLAQNEEAFREINERITMRVERFQYLETTVQTAVCECSDETCVDRAAVTPKEYRFARSKRNRFLIVPGHDQAEIERVVYRHDRCWIVEKLDVS